MAYTLEFEFSDHVTLWRLAHPAKRFTESDMVGRFQVRDGDFSSEQAVLPEQVLSYDSFAEGSMLWTAGAADALILKRLHKAAGYEAYTMVDMQSGGTPCVLTSWDHRADRPPLTEASVMAEFMVECRSELEFSELVMVFEESFEAHGASIMGRGSAQSEDHGDHFHHQLMFTAELAGTSVEPLANFMTDSLYCNVFWKVLDRVSEKDA